MNTTQSIARRRCLFAGVLCTVFVGVVTAAAEDLTVRKYRGLLAMYLHGVRKGFLLMNADLEARGQTPVFCMPSDLELGATDVIKMLDHLISLLPTPNDVAIEVVLLDGFKHRFPCQ
jgi:hypothetical protein